MATCSLFVSYDETRHTVLTGPRIRKRSEAASLHTPPVLLASPLQAAPILRTDLVEPRTGICQVVTCLYWPAFTLSGEREQLLSRSPARQRLRNHTEANAALRCARYHGARARRGVTNFIVSASTRL